MVFKAVAKLESSLTMIFNNSTVSFPNNIGCSAFFLPNRISVPSKYICFASILILEFEDIPTDFSPLIKILSVLAFNIILFELRIIWGKLN